MQVIAASQISGCASTTDKQLKAVLQQWLMQGPRRIDRLILQSYWQQRRLNNMYKLIADSMWHQPTPLAQPCLLC